MWGEGGGQAPEGTGVNMCTVTTDSCGTAETSTTL